MLWRTEGLFLLKTTEEAIKKLEWQAGCPNYDINKANEQNINFRAKIENQLNFVKICVEETFQGDRAEP